MKLRRRSNKGFSLVELMVVVVISGMLLVSLVSLYASTFRQQTRSFYKTVLGNQVSIAMMTLDAKLTQSNYIVQPPPNNSADYLNVAMDWDPDMNAAIGPNPTYHLFCVTGGNLVYKTGAYAGQTDAPACGGGMKLVGDVTLPTKAGDTNAFERPTVTWGMGNPMENKIVTHFDVTRPTSATHEAVWIEVKTEHHVQ